MMRKLIAILMVAVPACSSLIAQESVTGFVTDKKGNPVPGVRIEIPGTTEYVISDLDGSFTIHRTDLTKKQVYATYAGMCPCKADISDNMVIKLREENWWTKIPENWDWFAEVIFAMPNALGADISNPAYGLMIGRVKDYGYYLSTVTNTFSSNYESDAKFNGFITKETSRYYSATVGGIIRLGCPFHIYAGIGFARYEMLLSSEHSGSSSYNTRDYDEWYCDNEHDFFDAAIDIGVMFRINRLTLSGGASVSPGHGSCGNFGIGFSF